jgi:hypothetical protein
MISPNFPVSQGNLPENNSIDQQKLDVLKVNEVTEDLLNNSDIIEIQPNQ